MHNARTSFTMRVSFHCKALSMRRIYGVGEISKIIPTSIVVPTVVPLATTVSAVERRCCQQTTGRKRLSQPLRPNRRLLFVLANSERTVARDGLRRRRFVAHWQHAAAPIYCALPHSPLHLAFPSANVIHRHLLLASLLFPFFPARIYRQSRDFPCLCSFVFLFVAFSDSNFAIPFISLYFYSYISPFLPSSLFSVRSFFLAFYDFLFFFPCSLSFFLFLFIPFKILS